MRALAIFFALATLLVEAYCLRLQFAFMDVVEVCSQLKAENDALKHKLNGLEVKAPALQKVRADSSQTLAQKNNNPLNIKALGGDNMWQGQIGKDKFGHAIFSSLEYGVRAASFVLRSYARTHKIDTIRGVVRRFAEGNQAAYMSFLSKRLGVGVDEKIDLIQRMPELLKGMARFESGTNLPGHLFIPYDVLAKL